MKRKSNHKQEDAPICEDSEGELSDDFGNESEEAEECTAQSAGAKPTGNAKQPKKKAKLTKAELYKPPTNEELNSLKETENLFHSSLFRMQITELLSEVVLKEKRRKEVDEFLHKLKDVLLKLPSKQEHEITDSEWATKKSFSVPIIQNPLEVTGKMQFTAPTSVKVTGSYLLGTAIKPETHVDLAIELPASCIISKDHLNQRYLRKRALYITRVAMLLEKKDIIGKLEFTYHHGNHMRPILVVTPAGKLGTHVCVHIHTYVTSTLKLDRFHIKMNNVRVGWYRGEMKQAHSRSNACHDLPTPNYNTAVLTDLVMMQNTQVIHDTLIDVPGIKDGIILLKVWMNQRQLSKGYGGFSGFIMTMLVVHLLQQHKLNRIMSSYQVVRNTLHSLCHADWTTKGITMADLTESPKAPNMEEFHKRFDVVFVDPTGYVNLCAAMTKSTFIRVQHEAELSLKFMDTSGLDGFEALFMKPVPFLTKFDQCFHVFELDDLSQSPLCPADEVLDHCGDHMAVFTRHLLQLVDKAIGRRLLLHTVDLVAPRKWSVKCAPPAAATSITIGLLLDSDTAGSAVDKGPVADSPEAATFREFWGKQSELRRFQDGTICEAAVWNCSSVAERRSVTMKVLKHILKQHGSIEWEQVKFNGSQLDELLQIPSLSDYDTGEEQHTALLAAYDDLARVLRDLRDLPLAIHSIQGVSPALRYAETFPPLPVNVLSYLCEVHDHRRLVPKPGQRSPPYTPTITVQCILESSGKWPEDVGAVRRLRAAFHVQLASLLTNKHGLLAHAYPDHVLVLKDGVVFRVQIGYMLETTLLRLTKTPEGMVKSVITDDSIAMERQLVTLPKLSSALHGLQQEHPSYSVAVRLVKRWVAAQLLADCLTEEATELITAHLYLHPAPFSAPGSPLVALQRWLHLVGTHDWKLLPIIVNLNNELKKKDYSRIEHHFTLHRTTLPIMFISHPYELLRSPCTQHMPTAQLACRMVLLARESLSTLQAQLTDPTMELDYKLIFRPPLNAYNALIHLQQRHITRGYLAVDAITDDIVPEYMQPNDTTEVTRRHMPVVNYEPVQCYLKELREAFDDIGLFFYDPLGGSYIAVLWKQPNLTPQPFKVSRVAGRAPDMTSSGEELSLVPNLAAIVKDFEVLGAGLVTKVEELGKS